MDYHLIIKLVARASRRVVGDRNWLNLLEDGWCSCGDFWECDDENDREKVTKNSPGSHLIKNLCVPGASTC